MYIIWQHIIGLECIMKIMNVMQDYNTKYKISLEYIMNLMNK